MLNLLEPIIWSAATRRRFGRTLDLLLISMLASMLSQKRRRVAALQISYEMKTISKLAIAGLICLAFNFASAQQQAGQDQEEESSRQIVLDRFNKARPFSEATGGVNSGGATKPAIKAPVYRRTGTARISGPRKGTTPTATEGSLRLCRLMCGRSLTFRKQLCFW